MTDSLDNLRYGHITAKLQDGDTLLTYTNEAIGLSNMQAVGNSLQSCLVQLSSYFAAIEQVTNKAIHTGNINSNYYDIIVKSAKEVYGLL